MRLLQKKNLKCKGGKSVQKSFEALNLTISVNSMFFFKKKDISKMLFDTARIKSIFEKSFYFYFLNKILMILNF